MSQAATILDMTARIGDGLAACAAIAMLAGIGRLLAAALARPVEAPVPVPVRRSGRR